MSAIDDLTGGLETVDAMEALRVFIESGQTPRDEREAAVKLYEAMVDQQIGEAIARIKSRTQEFVGLVSQLAAIATRMESGAFQGSTVIRTIADRAGEAFSDVFGDRKLQPAYDTKEEAAAAILSPSVDSSTDPFARNPEPPAAGPGLPVIRNQPETLASKEYIDLKDEYVRFFFGGFIRDERVAAVERAAKTALAGKTRYESVGDPLGIPWWFIAAIHMMESTASFQHHLHNGDPLTRRTTHEPAGYPKAAPANGGSRYTWEESAADALKIKGFHQETNWLLSRSLHRLERMNGFGYRKVRIPTPYLWSFTSVYERGKYVRDHVFDPNARSEQVGAAALIKFLYKSGEISLYADENEQRMDPVFQKESQAANAVSLIPAPAVISHLPAFDQFLRGSIPNLTHFQPAEFLVKGSQHASSTDKCSGLNTDPPQGLWPNVLDLVKVLEEFRSRIDAPVKLLSVYRAPAYNNCIEGAGASQHMQFRAADFVVLKNGSGPADWARILDQMRTTEGIFRGGLKAYLTFVHVDTRGVNANW